MPIIGRFLSRDPLYAGASGSMPSTAQDYMYVRNNAANLSNQSGLQVTHPFRPNRCLGRDYAKSSYAVGRAAQVIAQTTALS